MSTTISRALAETSKPCMACPLCGELCMCSYAPRHNAGAAPYLTESATIQAIVDSDYHAAFAVQGYSTSSQAQASGLCSPPEPMSVPDFDNSAVAQDEPWRQEIASRVSSYRRRRGRKIEGEYSMRLDFDATPGAAPVVTQAVAEPLPEPEVSLDINFFRRTNALPTTEFDEADEQEFYEPESATEEQVASGYDPDFDFDSPRAIEESKAVEPEPVKAQPEPGNVIIFPTQPTYQPPPPPPYELAEPVFDRPRIIEVPEDILPTIEGPLFANMQLDTAEEPVAQESVRFDLPLKVAGLEKRLYAGLLDWLIVMLGFALLTAVAWRFMPEIPHTKLAIEVFVAIPAMLWVAFQYMFISYSGFTPGMIMMGIRLENFEGGSPTFRRRRQRAFSMVVSLISGGVGVVWALLDPDTLCWHDSISRTYVTLDN